MCWRAFVCDVMEDCAEAACKVAAPKPTKPEEVALWHRTRVGSAGALAPLLRALDPYGVSARGACVRSPAEFQFVS